MTRKWIADRIASLDPDVDFDEIWKLSTAYRPTDFVMNFIYAVTFPHFFVRELDAAPLFDGGKGKVLRKPDLRADDTSWKMQYWWHHGSRSELTAANVEAINRTHAHYAQTYPESFSRNGSYIYTLCYEAAGMHRLMLRVGLKGLTEPEKRAAVLFWARMGRNFKNVGTGEVLVGFPDSFDGIMRFMDEWEGEAVPRHAFGPGLARGMLDQFANRYFPKVLRPAARTWIVSLYPDHLLYAYDLKRPSPPLRMMFRLITKAMLWMGEHVVPDPHDTFEDRRQARRTARTPDARPIAKPMAARAVATCPYLQHGAAER